MTIKISIVVKRQNAEKKETILVGGNKYEVWSDFTRRGTFAKDIDSGVTKQISYSGYLSKELSIRKAIAQLFGLSSFRAK